MRIRWGFFLAMFCSEFLVVYAADAPPSTLTKSLAAVARHCLNARDMHTMPTLVQARFTVWGMTQSLRFQTQSPVLVPSTSLLTKETVPLPNRPDRQSLREYHQRRGRKLGKGC